MKTPSISDIVAQIINEVRTEQLVKKAALHTVNKQDEMDAYQTALGYRLKKLAMKLRESSTASTDVTVDDVYNFVERYGK